MNNSKETTEKLLKEMGVKTKSNQTESFSVVNEYFSEINEYRKKNYSLKNIYLSLKNSNRLTLSNGNIMSQSLFNREYYKLAANNESNIKFPSGRPKGSKTKHKKNDNFELDNSKSSNNDNSNNFSQKDIKAMSKLEKIENRINIVQNLKKQDDLNQTPEDNPFGFGKE